MLLNFFLIICIIYAVNYGLIYYHIRQIKKNIKLALLSGDDRTALSQCWAWCEKSEIIDLRDYWGKHRFYDLVDFKSIRRRRLLLPHVGMSIMVILFYQLMLRPTGILGLGTCKATPNCSNYALGVLLRYNFIIALSKIVIRVDSCHTGQPVSFSENFR